MQRGANIAKLQNLGQNNRDRWLARGAQRVDPGFRADCGSFDFAVGA